MSNIHRDCELSLSFCATGKTGLGHLRRITNIAREIVRLAPSTRLALYINAPVAGLEDDEIDLFSSIVVAPRDAIADRLAREGSDAVIVDTARLPGIETLPNPLCLVLRETVEEKLAVFRLPGGRFWDGVYIPNPPDHWQPDGAIIGAHRIEAVGWIYRKPATQSLRISQPENNLARRILIASGGGGTGDTANYLRSEIDNILECLKSKNAFPIHVSQVIGPRASPDSRLALTDEVIEPGPRLHEAFAGQDLIFSTAGYNSILELASIDTPVLLVPIQRTYDDQLGRARHWEKSLGLLHQTGDADRSVEWINSILCNWSRREPAALGPSGATACAKSILEIASRWSIRRNGDQANKSYTSEEKISGYEAALRSQKLFSACGRTPAGEYDPLSCVVKTPWISGKTARECFRGFGISHSRNCISQRSRIFKRVIDALADLHAVPVSTIELPRLNPLRLVHPRLASDAAGINGLEGGQQGDIRALAEQCRMLFEQIGAEKPAASDVITHGDFHCGQLILDAARDFTWLLDLDDLAIGHREYDLANFAVHFVTSADIYDGAIEPGFHCVADLLIQQYEQRTGISIDQALLAAYGATVLLRRALKFSEQKRISPPSAELLSVAETLLRHAQLHKPLSQPEIRDVQWKQDRAANGAVNPQRHDRGSLFTAAMQLNELASAAIDSSRSVSKQSLKKRSGAHA